uniref:Uncharacterized protein n=1 Tax=Aegilops tauschii subsp. strangulata TaxID=200361 RepID=A0A453EK18_AEGTS
MIDTRSSIFTGPSSLPTPSPGDHSCRIDDSVRLHICSSGHVSTRADSTIGPHMNGQRLSGNLYKNANSSQTYCSFCFNSTVFS